MLVDIQELCKGESLTIAIKKLGPSSDCIFPKRFLDTTTGWWNEGEALTVGDFVRRQQMGDTEATDDENVNLSISDHHTWVDDVSIFDYACLQALLPDTHNRKP